MAWANASRPQASKASWIWGLSGLSESEACSPGVTACGGGSSGAESPLRGVDGDSPVASEGGADPFVPAAVVAGLVDGWPPGEKGSGGGIEEGSCGKAAANKGSFSLSTELPPVDAGWARGESAIVSSST